MGPNPYEPPKTTADTGDGSRVATSLREAGHGRLVYVDSRGRVRGAGFRAFVALRPVLIGALSIAFAWLIRDLRPQGFSPVILVGLLAFAALLVAVVSIPTMRLNRAARLTSLDRADEAEPILRRVANQWFVLPAIRRTARVYLGLALWRLLRLEEALEEIGRAGGGRRLHLLLGRYFEVHVLAELGRLEEASVKLDSLPRPDGEYLLNLHWSAEGLLEFARERPLPSPETLEMRAARVGEFGAAGVILALATAWGFDERGLPARRDAVLDGIQHDPFAVKLVSRHTPALLAWYERLRPRPD